MGVRPPQDDDDEPDRSIEFGIAALSARLEESDLTYPASGEEIVEALSNPEIPYGPGGGTISLRAAIERCDREQFDSERQLHDALHPVFEEERTSSGVVGWLRSIFS